MWFVQSGARYENGPNHIIYLVIFVILSFCNPSFPYRALGKVEVFHQVGLGREGAEQEDRTASASGIQMEG